MIHTTDFSALSNADYEALRDRRMGLRNLYCSQFGVEHLMRLIESAKLTEAIDSSDSETLGARNMLVAILTDMGLFDEDFFRLVMKNLSEFPVLPLEAKPVDSGEGDI